MHLDKCQYLYCSTEFCRPRFFRFLWWPCTGPSCAESILCNWPLRVSLRVDLRKHMHIQPALVTPVIYIWEEEFGSGLRLHAKHAFSSQCTPQPQKSRMHFHLCKNVEAAVAAVLLIHVEGMILSVMIRASRANRHATLWIPCLCAYQPGSLRGLLQLVQHQSGCSQEHWLREPAGS